MGYANITTRTNVDRFMFDFYSDTKSGHTALQQQKFGVQIHLKANFENQIIQVKSLNGKSEKQIWIVLSWLQKLAKTHHVKLRINGGQLQRWLKKGKQNKCPTQISFLR